MPFRLRFGLLFSLLATILIVAGCSRKADSTGVLNVGMELNYPPFEMIDANGTPAGFSVALAKDLGEYLHRPINIVNMPFDALIPSLKTGRIDLVLSSLTITDERSESIDFSDPYMKSGLALLVGTESTIQKVEDLNQDGATVIVKTGTTGALYARKNLPKARLLAFQEAGECVAEIVAGHGDAFIYDPLTLIEYANKYPDKTKPILTQFGEQPWGIGIRKGNDALKGQVNDFLTHYRDSKQMDALVDKYLKDEKEEFIKRGVQFYY